MTICAFASSNLSSFSNFALKPKQENKGEFLKSFTEPEQYIVLDTETTGLSPSNNELIEVAAIKVKDHRIIDQYETLIKPTEQGNGRYIPWRITQITGINDRMVRDKPTFPEIVDQLTEFVEDLPIVAHNANFDRNFLNASYNRYCHKPFPNDFIDTLSMSRALLPRGSHSLEALAAFFNVVNEQAHRAMSDVLTTYKCYIKLVALAEKNLK